MTSPSPGSRTAGWQAVIHRHTAREAVGVRRGGPDRSFRAHRRWRPRRSICPAPSSIRWSSQQRVRHQRRRQIAGDRHQATDLRRRGGRRGDVARGPARRHRLSSGPAMSTTANFIPPRGAPRLCAPCSSRATSILQRAVAKPHSKVRLPRTTSPTFCKRASLRGSSPSGDRRRRRVIAPAARRSL